jgi:hypothetical protein
MAVIIQMLASASSDLATDNSALEVAISALKSSISALERSIDSLDGASGLWEKAGWYCAIAVGVGVIAEIFTIVREYLEDRHDWQRGIVRPPSRPSLRMLWFDVIATFVVVAGIFGEAGATGKVSSINSQLRSKTSELRAKSDQLLALVTLEAGSAASSALKAQGSADASGKLADRAQKTVDAVDKKAQSIAQALGMAQYFSAYREVRNSDTLKQEFAVLKDKPMIFRSYLHDGDGYFLCEELFFMARSVGVASADECAAFAAAPPISTGTNVYASDEKTMLDLNKVLSATTLYGAGGVVRPGPIVIFIGRKNNAYVGETAQTRAAEKAAAAMKNRKTVKHGLAALSQ